MSELYQTSSAAIQEHEIAALQKMLADARERTLVLAQDLTGAQLLGPKLRIVNPPLWEIGHLAWFQERWCLRRRSHDDDLGPSMLAHADALYDSSAVAHDTRWDLPLPTLDETLDYLRRVLQCVLERLALDRQPSLAYFAQLAALHEEMHCEAFTYTRQTLGYKVPPFENRKLQADFTAKPAGDALIAGGEFMLGARPDDGFVFDNEKWAHRVRIEPFSMAKTAVTNGDYAAFVDENGYARQDLWSPEGWVWRQSVEAAHPVYWRRTASRWEMRHYDVWRSLDPDAAVMHVNWFEADAYCRWAGRRLPTEAEWEYAASMGPQRMAKQRYPWGDCEPDAQHANLFGIVGDPANVSAFAEGDSKWGCRQMIGNVWEWTSDAFAPYPGFGPDPYKDYSQPWFGDHKVLRGGCFATRSCLIRNTWRNFYTPDRRDVFAGFRTCA